jgi:Na+/melibiose symporter-like transporter
VIDRGVLLSECSRQRTDQRLQGCTDETWTFACRIWYVHTISIRSSPLSSRRVSGIVGLGAFVAPLVATQFSNLAQNWHLHYIISTVLSFSNSVSLYLVFKLRGQHGMLHLRFFFADPRRFINFVPSDILIDARQPVRETNNVQDNVFKQIFRLPALHSLAIFAVIYVGVEVTLGGWIVTFIEDVRGAGSNAGYISSGFFGGLMVGRVGLIWLNQKVGPRRVLFIYLLLAIQYAASLFLSWSFRKSHAFGQIGSNDLGCTFIRRECHSCIINWLRACRLSFLYCAVYADPNFQPT